MKPFMILDNDKLTAVSIIRENNHQVVYVLAEMNKESAMYDSICQVAKAYGCGKNLIDGYTEQELKDIIAVNKENGIEFATIILKSSDRGKKKTWCWRGFRTRECISDTEGGEIEEGIIGFEVFIGYERGQFFGRVAVREQ